MLTVLDLFSGIGGFTLGLEATGGFRTVAFCESDPFCRRVLQRHWPKVPIHENAETASYGPANVITAGFPCQDISVAGAGWLQRAGLAGERSGLWREVVRALRVVRPQWIVVENVAALLDRWLGQILADLAANGYDAQWCCVPTGLQFGHRRERVIIVAYPHRERLPASGQCDATADQAQRFSLVSAVAGLPRPQPAPRVVRSVHGIPNRPHRIRALGNAVIPQVIEIVGRAILEAEQ